MIKTIGVLQFRNTSVGGVPIRGVNARYLNYASKFAENVAIIDASDQRVQKDIDMLLLPGGEDVDTLLYSENTPHILQGRANPHASWWFKNMLPKYEQEGIPMLGICMSMQALAALKGCRLVQHIDLPSSSPRSQLLDTLVDNQGRTIGHGKNTYKVNSIHHQGCYPEDIDQEQWNILYCSKEWDTVEIMEHKFQPILAVQFHPEEIDCKVTEKLFNQVIEKATQINNTQLAF